MAGPAQGDGGEEEEGRPRIRSNPQPVTHSRAATQPLLPAGQDRALLSNQLPPRVYVMALLSFLISSSILVLWFIYTFASSSTSQTFGPGNYIFKIPAGCVQDLS